MSNTNNNKGNQPPQELIQEFIKTEQAKIAYKTEELKLKNKSIDSNVRLAEKDIECQYQLLKQKPKEHRQTMIVYALCIGGLATLFLGFLFFLVMYDKVSFALEFLKWVGYILGLLLSFFAGRLSAKSKTTKKAEGTTEADVIE